MEELPRHFMVMLLSTSIKGILLIACTYTVLSTFKGLAARSRHLIWFLSIAGFVLLPFLSLLVQPFDLIGFRIPFRDAGAYETFTSLVTADFMSRGGVQDIASPDFVKTSAGIPHVFFRTGLFWIGIWMLGGILCSLKYLLGLLQLRAMLRGPDVIRADRFDTVIKAFSHPTGVKEKTQVFSSRTAASPFTVGVLKPVIILPARMSSWPAERIRPVLLHEIIHINRGDHLTQTAARIICGLFWFVPLVWFALSNLLLEQEKACDEEVLCNGVDPGCYAHEMLNMARTMVGMPAFTGLFMVSIRKRMFVKRIANILKKRGKTMKRQNMFVLGIAFLIAITLIAACGTQKSTFMSREISKKEALSSMAGTWENPDIEGNEAEYYARKVKMIPDASVDGFDGRIEYFKWSYLDTPFWEQRIKVMECWKDRKGNIYCQAKLYTFGQHDVNALFRMSKEGTVLESNYVSYAGEEFLTEIVDNDQELERLSYHIVYR